MKNMTIFLFLIGIFALPALAQKPVKFEENKVEKKEKIEKKSEVNEASGRCALCEKVDKIKETREEDEKKAARTLAKLLAPANLSKDKKMRDLELNSILAASVLLVEYDDEWEIPDYLVYFEDEYPKDFKDAMKKIPERERKELETYITKSRNMLKNGEPTN